MTALFKRCLQRLRSERGMTLIELMMATLIAAIGIGAVTTVLTGSRSLASDSERGDAAAHVAQQQLEEAQATPYAALALRQSPGTSANSRDPRFHVSTGGPTGFQYRWDQRATGAQPASPVLIDTANGGLQAATPWDTGRQSGVVYRFVTAYDDPSIANPPTADQDPILLNMGDGKRVTVAVTVTGGAQPRRPVVLSTVVLP